MITWLGLFSCTSGDDVDSDPLSEPIDSPVDSGTTAPPDDGIVTDAFVQRDLPRVDVLYVIDNSGSMSIHQDDLHESFPAFASWWFGAGVDPHLGVVTMDPGDGGELRAVGNQRWVDNATANPIELFTALASVGINGSFETEGLGAITGALVREQDGANAGFLRDDSSIYVILISDQDDQTAVTVGAFVEAFGRIAEGRPYASVNVIVRSQGPSAGFRYVEVAQGTSGAIRDLADSDYLLIVEDLELEQLDTEFCLSETPDSGTLDVFGSTTSPWTRRSSRSPSPAAYNSWRSSQNPERRSRSRTPRCREPG